MNVAEGEMGRAARLALLGGGALVLLLLARSPLVDRWLSRAIDRALERWTDLDVRDYDALLRLSEDYRVREVRVEDGDWLAGSTLRELGLRDEGIEILGIERGDARYLGAPHGDTRIRPGDMLVMYGREDAIDELERRRKGPAGDTAHRDAVAVQKGVRRREALRDAEGRADRGGV